MLHVGASFRRVLSGAPCRDIRIPERPGSSKPIRVIAQNEETCVVYGMPKAIYEAGVVDEVVPLDEVAQTITKNVGVK